MTTWYDTNVNSRRSLAISRGIPCGLVSLARLAAMDGQARDGRPGEAPPVPWSAADALVGLLGLHGHEFSAWEILGDIKLASQLLTRAHQQIAIQTNGDERTPQRQIAPGLCFISGQNPRSPARCANAPNRIFDRLLHIGMSRLPQIPERGRQIRWPDEHAVHTFHRRNRIQIVEPRARLHLHQQAHPDYSHQRK